MIVGLPALRESSAKPHGLLNINFGSNPVFRGDLNGSSFLNTGESGFLATLPVGGRGREFVGEFTGASTITAICHTMLRNPRFCMSQCKVTDVGSTLTT
jgi:hypothetical protein